MQDCEPECPECSMKEMKPYSASQSAEVKTANKQNEKRDYVKI